MRTDPAPLPDPQAAPPPLDPVLGFTAADLIAQQEALDAQAYEAAPFAVDRCTYALGPLRQPVYACRTCGGGGVCAGCSVACHADHDLIELFHRRGFRCDCGTPSLYRERTDLMDTGYPADATPCSLRTDEPGKGWNVPNDNTYTQNFQGRFCYCARGKTYDPDTEEEVRPRANQTMYQCIACEEWYHASCTSVKTALVLEPIELDAMLCDRCVRGSGAEILRTYAGARHWLFWTEAGPETWDGLRAKIYPTGKLYGEEGTEAPPAKRARVQQDPEGPGGGGAETRVRTCEAPPRPHPGVASADRLDLFLTPLFRSRICRCSACRGRWTAYPFLWEEEETYDPPVDGDDNASATSSSSTYDLAVAALRQLPRAQMLESLRAYQGLRDALYEHLRPYAERHEPVSEAAVRAFFEKHRTANQ